MNNKTKLSDDSRKRNWNKMQLLGICSQLNNMQLFSKHILTEEDMIRIGTAKRMLNETLNNWDESSLKLGFKPKKQSKHK